MGRRLATGRVGRHPSQHRPGPDAGARRRAVGREHPPVPHCGDRTRSRARLALVVIRRPGTAAFLAMSDWIQPIALGLLGWFLAGVCLALALGRWFRWLRE